jgi:hypothetical protein
MIRSSVYQVAALYTQDRTATRKSLLVEGSPSLGMAVLLFLFVLFDLEGGTF